jgi:hypothetical protein
MAWANASRWVGLVSAVVCLGCGADGSSLDGTSSGGGGKSGSNGGAESTGSGDLTSVGSGSGSTTPGCELGCSADLKKVVDCNGVVVSECSGDQACASGMCIGEPCVAAEEAKSSYGCDYWALKTPLIDEGDGACFAAFVANTWSKPVHIEIERQGQKLASSAIRIPKGQGASLTYEPYDESAGLPVGEVAILFLSRGPTGKLTFSQMPDCPAPAAVAAETAVNGTGRGHAFHIRTDRPVVAYQILPYGGGSAAATSATLLLPTSAWGDNYVAVNAYEKSKIVAPAHPSLSILAHEDATDVQILPKAAIEGGAGVAAAPAGQPVTYTLAAGEILQFEQTAELTGSPIQSNKPIAIWGGASCLNVPKDAAACDSAQQQIPPIQALGSEYAAVRYRNREGVGVVPLPLPIPLPMTPQNQGEEAPPWRIVGAVDGTTLSWEPAPPSGAPTSVGLGDVFEFNATGPFLVRSQDEDHPFYIAGYMTGGMGFGGEGDPEWVNLVPTNQYLDYYVFFTDPTYSETNLVVVRRKGPNGFEDVTLDCAGTLTGWEPLGEHEWTRIDLVTGDFESVGGCSNGRHEIKSAAPFGVTVWGWGAMAGKDLLSNGTLYVSYAYPAGMSIKPVNTVVVPPVPK